MTRKQSQQGKGRGGREATGLDIFDEVERDLDAMSAGPQPTAQPSGLDVLDETSNATASGDEAIDEDVVDGTFGATEDAVDDSESIGVDDVASHDEGTLDDDTTTSTTPPSLRSRPATRVSYTAGATPRRDATETPSGGGISLALATATTIAGAACVGLQTFAPLAVPRLLTTIADLGLSGGTLLLVGGLWLSMSLSARRQSAAARTSATRAPEPSVELEALAQTLESQRETTARIEALVAGMNGRSESTPPSSGEEIGHVLMALQRQDEKTNNLTRAIKMYGQPLIEITNQVSESGTRLRELETRLDAMKAGIEQRVTRAEEALRAELKQSTSQTGLQNELTTLAEASKKAAGLVEAGAERTKEIEGHTRTVDTRTKAIDERTRDVDGRTREIEERTKRLETSFEKLQQQLSESVTRLERLATRDDGATKFGDVLTTLEKSLDKGLQQVRSDVSGIVQQVQKLQTATQATRTVAAAAPTAPAAPPAPAATAPTAAAPAHSTAAPAGDAPAIGGLAQSIAGSKTDGGKGVMSAIAKLKKLKNG